MGLLGLAAKLANVVACRGICRPRWDCSAVILGRRHKGGTPSGMKSFAIQLASDALFGRLLSASLEKRGLLIDEADSAPPPTAEEIPELIDDLLNSDNDLHRPATIRLRKAGEIVVPFLTRALDDPRSTWTRPDNHVLTSSPLERVWDLLWPLRPRSLGERFDHLWNDADWRIFTKAIRARAATGNAELVSWVIQLLRDESHEDAHMRREAVCVGLDLALDGGWADATLIDAIVEWARENITSNNGHPLKWSIALLVSQRKDEAIALLTSDKILSLDNTRNIHFVLDELSRQQITIPAAVVRPMLNKALSATEWPWNCTFDSALQALDRTEPQVALEIAESVIANKKHSRRALKYLYHARGLPAAHHTDPPEDMELSEEERRCVTCLSNVCEATGQIGNGGLSQYFFNSSGDNWRRDQGSFAAVGYPEGTKALEQAAFMLAADGASPKRAVRIKQYAALSEDREKELKALSGVFYGTNWDIAEYRFMVKHAELFRRIKAARVAAGMAD